MVKRKKYGIGNQNSIQCVVQSAMSKEVYLSFYSLGILVTHNTQINHFSFLHMSTHSDISNVCAHVSLVTQTHSDTHTDTELKRLSYSSKTELNNTGFVHTDGENNTDCHG